MKRWTFRVWGCLGAIYVVSGLLWLPVLLSGRGMATPLNTALVALITFVPSAAGVVFTYLTKDREGRRDFWRRAWRWPSASRLLLAGALALYPLVVFAAYSLASLQAGTSLSFDYARALFSNLPLLLQFLFVEITFGPLSEELGWRGYLLDELQSRWSALRSALVLGIFWGLWHTPAFLVPGMTQYNMGGIFSAPYWGFVLTSLPISIVITWAYNNTGRSTLVAGILMHFLANVTLVFLAGNLERFAVPASYWVISPAINFAVAAVVVWIWGPKTLSRWAARRPRQAAPFAG